MQWFVLEQTTRIPGIPLRPACFELSILLVFTYRLFRAVASPAWFAEPSGQKIQSHRAKVIT